VGGDVLTIVVGLAGILVSVVASADAYRRGKRAAKAEKEELLGEITAQREMLSAVVQQFSAVASGAAAEASSAGASAAGAETAANVVVRAALGTLLNESGEVAFHRLLQEVSHALGHPSFSEVAEVLQGMRDDGLVEWTPPGAVHARPRQVKVERKS
jgi:hypothetical protein